jgi:hypothetical protein
MRNLTQVSRFPSEPDAGFALLEQVGRIYLAQVGTWRRTPLCEIETTSNVANSL